MVGLGKIGLPLAVQYASKGHQVIGADANARTVALVNAGQEPFPGEHMLAEFLGAVISAGRLVATTDTAEAVFSSRVIVVAVPLVVNADSIPDFTAMEAATDAIATGLQPGSLVIYETTLPVGTTRDRLTPLLESRSGLASGKDFHVVFSPERVLTGRVFEDLRRYPKLVGGMDPVGSQLATEFYEAVLDFDERADLSRPNGVWDLGSAEAAELAKLAETTYRDVNIALANQFALYADKQGIDVYAVIEACNSQPFSHIHGPGIAVGGHCIPVYPRLYLWNDPDATVVHAAREANVLMPEHAVARLEASLGSLQGLDVAVLGASYRGGVKETAFSGVFPVVTALRLRGATPRVHDPLFADEELLALGLEPFHRGEHANAAILQSDHETYREWTVEDVPGLQVVLDGRHVLTPSRWHPAAVIAIGAGRGDPGFV